jgi:hypothetical protein
LPTKIIPTGLQVTFSKLYGDYVAAANKQNNPTNLPSAINLKVKQILDGGTVEQMVKQSS